MTVIDSLYALLGVSPSCTDEELRRAYLRAIRENHPDLNPHHVEAATRRTQQIIAAYEAIKNHRSGQSADAQGTNKYTYGVSIQIISETGISIKDIANRKAAFRREWEHFQKDPSNLISALRLIHAAFRAERQDSFINLLLNPLLIDSASLLVSLFPKDEVSETLIRWADFLVSHQRLSAAVQILEDAYAAGADSPEVKDKLRTLHYSWAQYSDPTTGRKATPEVRIKHLQRILDLGFEYDYIYKLMAEAYHDLGDDNTARAYLHRAYEINPELSGAVRISRALGISPPQGPSRPGIKPQEPPSSKIRPQGYKYSRPEQIPSSAQIYAWTREGRWDAILNFANPYDYSPRILPKAREILRNIAISLGRCSDPKALEALVTLLNFNYYWDVSEAALVSLSKIGDERTLAFLEEFQIRSRFGESHLKATLEICKSYLRARITHPTLPATRATPVKLLAQAKRAFANGDYGRARALLEHLIKHIDQSHPEYIEVIITLARSCAEMNDVRTSIELIKPVLHRLPEQSRTLLLQDVVSWLWSDLVSQQYDPIYDENYLLALEIHLELALTAETADDVLRNLWRLTRWLELLGARDLIQQIRRLIRTEAPGTWCVDRHDREQYIAEANLSPYMRDYLQDFQKRIQAGVVAKLKSILGSPHELEKNLFSLGVDD